MGFLDVVWLIEKGVIRLLKRKDYPRMNKSIQKKIVKKIKGGGLIN